MNQSLKWKNDYIFLLSNTTKKTKKKMDSVLDRMYNDIEFLVSKEFPQYIAKVSKVKKSFYVLVRKSRRKILGKKTGKVV